MNIKDLNNSNGHAASLGSGVDHREPETPTLPGFFPYDTSTLSFGLSGGNPISLRIIRAVEWATGKITLLRIVNEFEKSQRAYQSTFWAKILEILDITITTTDEEIAQIPATGPVVVVANHPFGFIDGLILTNLVSRVRPDLKILTRAFLPLSLKSRPTWFPLPFRTTRAR